MASHFLKLGKILEIFGKVFLKFGKIFSKNRTTVYKAGLSKLEDWKNLVTKNITRYPVQATFKILKNKKIISPISQKKIGDVFFYIFESFKSC